MTCEQGSNRDRTCVVYLDVSACKASGSVVDDLVSLDQRKSFFAEYVASDAYKSCIEDSCFYEHRHFPLLEDAPSYRFYCDVPAYLDSESESGFLCALLPQDVLGLRKECFCKDGQFVDHLECNRSLECKPCGAQELIWLVSKTHQTSHICSEKHLDDVCLGCNFVQSTPSKSPFLAPSPKIDLRLEFYVES